MQQPHCSLGGAGLRCRSEAGLEASCSTAVQHAAGQLGLLHLLGAGALQAAAAGLKAGLEAICSRASCRLEVSRACPVTSRCGGAPGLAFPAGPPPGECSSCALLQFLQLASHLPADDRAYWQPGWWDAAHSCCIHWKSVDLGLKQDTGLQHPLKPASRCCPEPIRCCTPVKRPHVRKAARLCRTDHKTQQNLAQKCCSEPLRAVPQGVPQPGQ